MNRRFGHVSRYARAKEGWPVIDLPNIPGAVPTPAPIMIDEPTAARITGLCPKSLYNARRAGLLAYVKVGTAVRYLPADLQRWAVSMRRGGRP
jgi:Helix-turn-helix domain